MPQKALKDNEIILSDEEGISSMYIKFDRIPKEWKLTNGDTEETIKQIIDAKDKMRGVF